LLTGRQQNLDYLQTLNGDLEIFPVSITELDALRPAFVGGDYVYHQAALPSVSRSVENPLETHEHCTTGTLNVLIAARDADLKRVVYAASTSAYGETEAPVQDESLVPDPISPYAVAKLAAEYYCRSFTHVYGLETVCLRYFNVFGPRQDPTSHYAAAIPLFINLMLKGKTPTIYGDGEQTRDFTYVDNIVHGNLLASTAPDAAGTVMNLATGESVSVNALISALNRILGTNLDPIHAPERAGDIKFSRANIDRARDLLDFAPVVDFETGLARTVAWYRDSTG
jgi:UDP-glucose 4-epimerase